MHKKIFFSSLLVITVVLLIIITFTNYITTDKGWSLVVICVSAVIALVGQYLLENDNALSSSSTSANTSTDTSSQGKGELRYTFGAGDTIDFDGY